MLISFRRAYINKKTGEQITDPMEIALKYIRFYFWVDLISCFPFELFTENTILRFSSMIKVFRLFRWKKILRFMGLS